MKKHYTYIITDTITNEFYIGVRSCKVNPSDDTYMGSMYTWKKQDNFNSDNHKKTIISIYPTREIANEIEKELIDKFVSDPLNRNYHNRNSFCNFGRIMSEETKSKISKSKIGGVFSEEHKIKNNQ